MTNIGKTTFVKRHLSGEFSIEYKRINCFIATIGCSIHDLDFTTNKGKVIFHTWDTAGQEKFGGLRDGYYIGAECCMVMFDLSFRNSYKTVPVWYRDVVRFVGHYRIIDNIPMVIVGTKHDIRDQSLEEERMIFFRRKFGVQYIEVSARKNYNYEKPFLYLFRKLLDDPTIYYTEEVALVPPDITIEQLDPEKVKKLLNEANKKELPDLDY
uniref:GTP-binding nuclear protein n=1 Tax=Amorphochlora amoebiformis TaxID=1561963 RepID=A0A0H5BR25_9EUKA|nr:GTP-binding nuclear protein RAN [Amorphochlora amoebiformis]